MSSEKDENGNAVNSSNSLVQNGRSSKECDSSKQNNSNGNRNDSTIDGNSPNKPESPGQVPSSPGKSSNVSPDVSFVHLNPEDAIRENTLTEVIRKFGSKQYNICEDEEPLIYGKCKLLFEKDYVCKVVNNCNYSTNYPIGIIIPVAKKGNIEGSSMDFDDAVYSKLVEGAPEARLRSRFIVPVILFDNKFICRSGTLTVKLSAFYELAMKTPPPRTTYDEDAFGILRTVTDTIWNLGSIAYRSFVSLIDWNAMSTLFSTDVEILKHLKIERVCDLMVEYSKLYKQTVSVSSTEKAHEDLYGEVKIEEMPYPGCEFFSFYHDADRNAKDLVFDWKQTDVTRGLKLTRDPKAFFPEIDVDDHKNWDLIQLTRNYLKIMLSYLVTSTGGMLIHCISGWDRTPLFISLLRLSLWADGIVHENLEFEDMAYLTVAYDWFLFGHNLPNRIQKDEEVMHFCFNFLEHITSDEFSITRLFQELPVEEKRDRIFPEFVPGRRLILNKIRTLVLDHYDVEIIQKNTARILS